MQVKNTQTGNAMIITIIILAIGLVAALGFVFWQNVINKDSTPEPTKTTTSTTTESTPAITYSTFTTDTHNVSFEYPSTWSLADHTTSDSNSESVAVKNADGKKIAELSISDGGVGGTCNDTVTYRTVATHTTNVPAANVAYVSYSILPVDGAFKVNYGLTDRYTEITSGETCPNTFYYLVEPTADKGFSSLSFANAYSNSSSESVFSTAAEAEAYASSDEYKALVTMFSSLTY
jgi:PsbP-like protein